MKKYGKILTILFAFTMVFALAFTSACDTTSDVTLQSISVDTSKAQTEFDVGDVFSYDGVVVTALYSDKSTVDVTSESTFSSPNTTTEGTKTVTVTYEGMTATYEITVSAVCTHKCPVCGLCMDLSSTDSACTHKCGEDRAESYTFEAENTHVVTEAGSMGSVTTFTDREDYSTGELVSGRGNFSSNTGASITFNLNVDKATTVTLLVRVSRGTSSVTTFTDVALPVLTTANGSEILDRSTTVEKTSSGAWFDFMEISLGCIELTAGENSIKFAPLGTAYNFDYIALLSDEVVTWSDGEAADIIGTPRHGTSAADSDAEQLTLQNSSFDETANTFTATVAATYDLTSVSSVTMNGTAVNSFTITYDSTNLVYNVELDISNITLSNNTDYTIRFVAADGTIAAIGSATYVAGTNINDGTDDSTWTTSSTFYAYPTAGDQTLSDSVVISSKLNCTTKRPNAGGYYPVGNLDMNKGQYVTFYINSTVAETVGLYMELGCYTSSNLMYDWADITVNGVSYYSDAAMPTGTTYESSNTFTLIGFIPLQAGNNEITFTVNSTNATTAHNIYGLQFTSQTAELSWGTKPYVESIAYSSSSTVTTDYLAGESFDTTGLILDATWSNGSTSQITSGFTVSPSGALSVSDTYVTISYTNTAGTELTVQIPITVTEAGKTLESLSIKDGSTYDTTFDAGDTFDASGITLVANYSDNTSEELDASDWSYSPTGELSADDTCITFSYTYAGVEKTYELAITVNGYSYNYTALSAAGSTTLNDGVYTTAGTSSTSVATNRANDRGYYPIGGVDNNLGATVNFTVYAASDTTAALYAEFNLDSRAFSNIFTLTVNGTEVTSTATLYGSTKSFEPSNTYVYLADISLVAGQANIITFTTINTSADNIYGIKLISNAKLVYTVDDATLSNASVSEKVVTATATSGVDLSTATSITVDNVSATAFTVIAGNELNTYSVSITFPSELVSGTTYAIMFYGSDGLPLAEASWKYETTTDILTAATYDDSGWNEYAFYAVNTSGSLVSDVTTSGSTNINTSRTNSFGIGCVGNLDGNNGATVTFSVSLSAAATVGLYIELGLLSSSYNFSDWATITINGTEYISSAAMLTGTNYIASNQYLLLGYVALNAGTNTITFTVISSQTTMGRNIYGLKFTAESATVSWATISSSSTPVKLAAATSPSKTSYTAGETFDATGMTIRVLYSDNTAKYVTGYTYTTDALTSGTTSVTVSYTEDGTTVTVDVEITVT